MSRSYPNDPELILHFVPPNIGQLFVAFNGDAQSLVRYSEQRTLELGLGDKIPFNKASNRDL